MRLLADGPVSLSDGVCAFLGNVPSLFWLEKSKPFMLWSGKNETRVCSSHGNLFLCRGKKGKPTASCTPVCRLWVRMRHVIPVGIICLLCCKKEKTHCVMKASAYVVPVGICWFVVVKNKKTHYILKASQVVRFHYESHSP